MYAVLLRINGVWESRGSKSNGRDFLLGDTRMDTKSKRVARAKQGNGH